MALPIKGVGLLVPSWLAQQRQYMQETARIWDRTAVSCRLTRATCWAGQAAALPPLRPKAMAGKTRFLHQSTRSSLRASVPERVTSECPVRELMRGAKFWQCWGT